MEHARTFRCFGGAVTVLVGGAAPDGTTAEAAAAAAEALLLEVNDRLTRFDPASELSRLNADPRPAVPASATVRRLAAAVRTAGVLTGGLVDATLLTELEQAGYERSREGAAGLAAAPDAFTGPARPARAARWRDVRADDVAGTVVRPPGVRLDAGGLGKGLAADLAGELLAAHPLYCVACEGDLRIGGTAGVPRPVTVTHPVGREVLAALDVVDGGVATSGVHVRSWTGADGRPAHHLIDPRTGRPAHTGLVQVTALAPTGLEAEIRAKAALLAGPDDAGPHLPHGGVLLHADGRVERLAPPEPPPPRASMPGRTNV
ncbi:FAD:protein FMN transferase [Paraconexibacter antarcticus]|uniref:FAD:protein FMN transferase n=1 Tax=Paraconexibacter antarcticus TaxID=2949664 RepID=A0ABY5DKV7_9ACTN|nr:FAD:protein FMN transferase [Paraconexibacter antarcticus]UTI62390.1 FAD:protein FMN transferase [Paraconexibacter antarcticus]